MKRIFFTLMCLVLSSISILKAQDLTEYRITDPKVFPDPYFRRWMLDQPFGTDGILTYSERIYDVKVIDLDVLAWSAIRTLEGIQLFENLHTLIMSGTQVTSFDPSILPNLRFLICDRTQLTSLDLSSNPLIAQLECNNSKLASLTLPQNGNAIERLSCKKSELTSLHLPDNQYNIVELTGSPLQTLTFGSNVAIERLYCDSTQLTSLDIPALNNADLLTLNCSDNHITSLDLSGKIRLSYLYCQNNELTTLDVTENTGLNKIGCWGNHLTTLDITHCPDVQLLTPGGPENYFTQDASLPIHFKGGHSQVQLKNGYVHGSVSNLIITFHDGTTESQAQPTLLNDGVLILSPQKKEITGLTYDFVAKSDAKTMKVHITPSEYGIPVVYQNFPDDNFRKYLSAQTYGTDGIITPDEISQITSIKVRGKNISSLTGVELFTELTTLDCAMNNLTQLDVNPLSHLTNLQCWENRLTTLTTNRLTQLQTLVADNNQLTSFAIPYSQLTYLNLRQNALTTINLDGQNALTNLDVADNQLTTLDIHTCTDLTNLDCSNNQLTTLDTSHNTQLQHLYCQSNQLTTLDPSANPGLLFLYCNDNRLTALDVATNTQLQILQCHNNRIHGEAMRALVLSMPDNTVAKKLRAYHQGSANEDNQISPAMVDALSQRNWSTLYTTDGNSWMPYAGDIATYDIYVAGVQVTSANANDILGDRRQRVTYNEMENALLLRSATITCQGIAIRNASKGLDIRLSGTNVITSTDNVGLQADANTTISAARANARMLITAATNGIYIANGTLTVRDGATLLADASQATPTPSLTNPTGCGICGRIVTRTIGSNTITQYYGTLQLQGMGTQLATKGSLLSIGPLRDLKMTGFEFTSPSNARWNAQQNAVYDGTSPAKSLVTIEYNYKPGDVNEDDVVDADDVSPLADIIVGKASVRHKKTADITQDGTVSIADLTTLINTVK